MSRDDFDLSKIWLFSTSSAKDLRTIKRALEKVTVPPGRMLCEQGTIGREFFFIVKGKASVRRNGRKVATLGPGGYFGELSLFDPGPRTATATALTDAVVLGLGHQALRPWLTGRPEVAESLLQALAQRLRRTNDALADLVFSDVPGRVAKALLDLGERFGQSMPDGLHVTHDMTQEELAQLVGASRETVNKALADFASRGWLRLESRSVVLLDVERLQRRAR